jgi:hypothetical protein
VRLPVKPQLVALLVAATFSCAHAQTSTTPEQPFVRQITVGATPTQIMPRNDQRSSIEFCNPNASITCAVCPTLSRVNSAAITCAVNGAGSVTLPVSTCWGKDVQGTKLKTSWNAVCSSSAAMTAFETE